MNIISIDDDGVASIYVGTDHDSFSEQPYKLQESSYFFFSPPTEQEEAGQLSEESYTIKGKVSVCQLDKTSLSQSSSVFDFDSFHSQSSIGLGSLGVFNPETWMTDLRTPRELRFELFTSRETAADGYDESPMIDDKEREEIATPSTAHDLHAQDETTDAIEDQEAAADWMDLIDVQQKIPCQHELECDETHFNLLHSSESDHQQISIQQESLPKAVSQHKPVFNQAVIYLRKGRCHYIMKDYNKSIKAFTDGLKLEPDDEELKAALRKSIAAIRMSAQTGPGEGLDVTTIRSAAPRPASGHQAESFDFRITESADADCNEADSTIIAQTLRHIKTERQSHVEAIYSHKL